MCSKWQTKTTTPSTTLIINNIKENKRERERERERKKKKKEGNIY